MTTAAPHLRLLTVCAATALAAVAACSSPSAPNGGGTGLPAFDAAGQLDTAQDVGSETDTADVATGEDITDAGPADTGAGDAGSEDSEVDAGPACVDPCEAEGQLRCVPTGPAATQSCGDPDADGCFQWSDATPCAATEVCKAGACVPKCPDQDCTVSGAKKCSADGKVVQCFDFNGDGCLAWGGATFCAAGKVCAEGACAETCKDACTTSGATQCEGKAVQTCGDSNSDGCLDWGTAAACAAGQLCSNGACVATCKDECTQQGATQCAAGGVQTCDDYDQDGCLQWGTATACPVGEGCSAGACAKTCKDECTVQGATTCQLGKIATCDDFDNDGCLQWGSGVPCGAGQVCAEGACAASCTDACTAKGATQCSPAGQVQTCDDFDDDGCLDWGSGVACAQGSVCSNGACVATCKDACGKAGEKQCVPGSTTQWQQCGDSDGDGCLGWETAQSCGANLVCAGAGGCEKTCKSTCDKAGAVVCEGDALRTCGDYNNDGCLELGTPVPCGVAEACAAGVCKPKPPPAKVVIQELLYDSDGADTEVFVELKGPAGTALAGFSLVGINGNGGVTYATVPLVGSIGSDGLFVVAHSKATGAIAAAADQKDDGVDLQNGPDSVQLRFGAQVVDAVGYGAHGTGLTFAGEGKPAPDPGQGQGIGRAPDGKDTDDNSVDFYAMTLATPGAPNPPPCTPKSCGDLGYGCGTADDGCGKVLDCGGCPTDKVCGGDHQCGDKPCAPKTCKDLAVACGPASDGCEKTLDCGGCGSGQLCDKGQCICKPKTCADVGAVCGEASDGCGKTLQCGDCQAGQSCTAGQCLCKPKTCEGLGVSCGTPSDGCGKTLQCGSCGDGKVCGPQGSCDCAPKSCSDQALLCGVGSDSCGKALDCGTCEAGKLCEAGACVCKPKTCSELGCGTHDDGCGKTLDCGACKGGCGQACPTGWAADGAGVCKGGDNKDVDLSYCTVKVAGTITHDGQIPQISQYCSPSVNKYSTYVQVELEEVNHGYKYTVANTCDKGATQGFAWSREIYPGTYKVSVYGTTNYADFPVGGTQVIHKALVIDKDVSGLVLDYKSVDVAGSILHDGVKPAISQYCSPSVNKYSTYVQVELQETTWGYKYTFANTCDKGAAQGFDWARKIFPGTYKVSVYGTTNYADFPVGGTQVIDPAMDLTASKAGIVLDYKSVDVAGSILHDGVKPAISQYCSPSVNKYSTYVQVELQETTWGYKYTVANTCDKGAAQGFDWARKIFPGTYKVSVYGTTNYADFPVGGTQVIDPAMDLTASKAGIVLDYKSVDVAGSILHDGVKPAISQYCSPSVNKYSTYVQVELQETTWGYKYTVANTCDKGAAQGFDWARKIFPGTYKVSVYGTTNYADFPVGGTQIIDPAMDLTVSKAGIVLDYKSVDVAGSILHDGLEPAISQYCSPSVNKYSTYVQVELQETTWGYKYTVANTCDKGAAQGFDWARKIFPGTYKVSVYGTTNYADFPIGGTQVIDPAMDLSTSKAGIVLDYKSVDVAGAIFHNGSKPAISQYCSPSVNKYSTYVQVELQETTWGYKYTVANTCDKGAAQGFDWARTIFPGTYQVKVYGTSNYADFPIGGTQVVVEAIAFGK
ncbi:MAG: hypothetical protein H6747_12985 [Deltaproteobacteria bacterium]|nr:hypothetical protein [Deltaproteobacteria bacterium]